MFRYCNLAHAYLWMGQTDKQIPTVATMKFFKFKTKNQKRLDEIVTRIHNTEVSLLAAKLNMSMAEGQLQVLRSAKEELQKAIELEESFAVADGTATDCAMQTD